MTEIVSNEHTNNRPDPTLVEPYELIERLGEGSYGAVWLARNLGVSQLFALKILKRELAMIQKEREAFLKEADLLYQVGNIRVIQARHVNAQRDIPWFAMDYADRGSLDKWVERLKVGGELRFEQVVGLGVELCECLSALHHYKVVHYDLKPHNVLIRGMGDAAEQKRGTRYRLPPDERLVLGDLGLARTGDDVAAKGPGTPRYSAPEVFRDGGSELSDLFALGMMLYEFAHPITDKPVRPYEGRRVSSDPRRWETLENSEHWGAYRPIHDVRDDVPAEFDEVISKLLAPSPSDRYADAAQARQALDRLLRKRGRPLPKADVVEGVKGVLATAADGIGGLPDVDPDVYQSLDRASERLHRRLRVAVLSHGGTEASQFTLFLAGESYAATAPAPYGSVISYLCEGDPEQAIVESQSGGRIQVRIERDDSNAMRAELETTDVRNLTLGLDHHSDLDGFELVDVPMPAVDPRELDRAISLADLVVALVDDLAEAEAVVPRLRRAASQTMAGPCGLIAVDGSSHGFGGSSSGSLRAMEDLGFQRALLIANAGLTLRVLFQEMRGGEMDRYIAASGALALCEAACSRTDNWSIAKNFIDHRDQLEHDFPQLRELRFLRDNVRGKFSLPSEYARELRQIFSQPTPTGKLAQRADEANVESIRRGADERMRRWLTALADDTIPAESTDAARAVVATLRRLRDVEEV